MLESTAPARRSPSSKAAASSGVSSWKPTPSQARRTRPSLTSWALTRWARSAGTAKPMPVPRPMIIVLMPRIWPSRPTSGPPELPGLMLASVCR